MHGERIERKGYAREGVIKSKFCYFWDYHGRKFGNLFWTIGVIVQVGVTCGTTANLRIPVLGHLSRVGTIHKPETSEGKGALAACACQVPQVWAAYAATDWECVLIWRDFGSWRSLLLPPWARPTPRPLPFVPFSIVLIVPLFTWCKKTSREESRQKGS